MADPRQPVLVGAAQLGGPDQPFDPLPSPQQIMAATLRAALDDAGVTAANFDQIDTVSIMRTYADSAPHYISPFGRVDNYPALLAEMLGAGMVREIYPTVGGNSPQYCINRHAAEIAAGEADFVVLAGAETMLSERRARKTHVTADWNATVGHSPTVSGDARLGVTPCDLRHGLGLPISCYPLFDNAIAHRDGRTTAEHQHAMGRTMAPFAAVAADNPLSIDRSGPSAEDIATISAENRLVAWPYTKSMCAREAVDLSAAVVMMSCAMADKMGIAKDRRVYVRGTADINEKWFLGDRVDFSSAPAIGVAGQLALAEAGLGLDNIDLFDLYSCFPCAVSLACEALGLSPDDPRGLTLTGGLPFFGGPGNNYTMHAVAEVVHRLRDGAARNALVNGNGWYLTKHSLGVYSREPGPAPFKPIDRAPYQAKIDALPNPSFVEQAEGPATVESFAVTFDRSGPAMGIIMGRLAATGERFVANTPNGDKDTLAEMMQNSPIGTTFKVAPQGNRNIGSFS